MLRVTSHGRNSELVHDILGAHEEIDQVWLKLKRGECVRERLPEHADGREEEDRRYTPSLSPILLMLNQFRPSSTEAPRYHKLSPSAIFVGIPTTALGFW